ncbi:MAG: Gfo/Idh/MocA family oxidoreductase [bacterium]|nr:Gfo/Idh/MocA family oxidoreductase [bacterium]
MIGARLSELMSTESFKNSLNVAVIGKSGHAARHIEVLRQKRDVKLHSVYYPKKVNQSDLPLTTNFDDLLETDAVIISSPTPTHVEYMELLENYEGYILVEKPAVSTEEQALKLKSWPDERKSRVKINYNLRHSEIANTLSRVLSFSEMGAPIFFDVHTSHGLAFKDSYKHSWRDDLAKSFGVMELVGTHYINLAISLFGPVSESQTDCCWVARPEKKVAPDTVFTRLKMRLGVIVNLFHSYAAPFYNRMMLNCTNGYWEYNGHEAKLHYPRDSFDSKGRFTAPPLVERKVLDFATIWRESLSFSLDDFLDTVRERGSFSSADFDIALDTMGPIFRARSSFTKES